MAEPSACRLITRRPGAANAAPSAIGGPQPIAPPVMVRWENGGQPCLGGAAGAGPAWQAVRWSHAAGAAGIEPL